MGKQTHPMLTIHLAYHISKCTYSSFSIEIISKKPNMQIFSMSRHVGDMQNFTKRSAYFYSFANVIEIKAIIELQILCIQNAV